MEVVQEQVDRGENIYWKKSNRAKERYVDDSTECRDPRAGTRVSARPRAGNVLVHCHIPLLNIDELLLGRRRYVRARDISRSCLDVELSIVVFGCRHSEIYVTILYYMIS